MGNSSYLNSFWADFFLSTIKKNLLDIKKPILIVGGGYGAGVVELLQLGANTIYFNDLDAKNTNCAKNFIEKALPKEKNKVHYLPGNISTKSVISSIPDGSLGMVYAKHVIPFLSAIELQKFIKNSKQKLYPNGMLLIIFENPRLDEQMEIVNQIKKIAKQSNSIPSRLSLDNATKHYYKAHPYCQISDYEKTPVSLREPGFPCVLAIKETHFNFLMPDQVSSLLEKNGFTVVGIINLERREDTFIIVAQKK